MQVFERLTPMALRIFIRVADVGASYTLLNILMLIEVYILVGF